MGPKKVYQKIIAYEHFQNNDWAKFCIRKRYTKKMKNNFLKIQNIKTFHINLKNATIKGKFGHHYTTPKKNYTKRKYND